MKPGAFNFTIWKGASFGPLKFIHKDENGAPVPLTGLTARANARSEVHGDVAFDLQPVITDEAAGEVTYSLTLAQVNALPEGKFAWDETFEQSDGERLGPFVRGIVTVQLLATRP